MQKDHLVSLPGRNLVLEALKQGRDIKKILIDRGAKGEKIDKVLSVAASLGITVEKVQRSVLDQHSDTHQGVVALAEPKQTISSTAFLKKYKSSERTLSVAILRSLDFEHNLGAIIRSASAAGINAVVVPKGRKSQVSQTVERVSMGGINDLEIIEESFYSSLKNFKKAGFKLVALEINGGIDYFEEDLTGDVAFIFGSESETLTDEVLQKVDTMVKIPMLSSISSLNVSVSAGIVFYERVRQITDKS
jgi:23S rRNA (guanosine2251-2'-O)-methyltransferase